MSQEECLNDLFKVPNGPLTVTSLALISTLTNLIKSTSFRDHKFGVRQNLFHKILNISHPP